VTTRLDALVRMSDDEWAEMIGVHLNGTFYGTRAVAKELTQQGVRVNAIAPGFVDTPLLKPMGEALVGAVKAATPANRLARPEEIAAAVSYLVGDESGYVVGESFSVNGGMLTR